MSISQTAIRLSSLLSISCLLLCLAIRPVTAEESASTASAEHIASAHALFSVMRMEKTFGETISNMVDMQVKQQPMIAPYKGVMLKFFDKYMSWDSLKDEMAAIYVEEFSQSELEELTAFYKTAVGQKAATRMPHLMSKGAELGAKRVQAHMTELQQMIAAEAQKAAPKNPMAP